MVFLEVNLKRGQKPMHRSPRLIWLLAMPYVVTVSTRQPCSDLYINSFDCGNTYWELNVSTTPAMMDIECNQKYDCRWLFDMAEALNQAREQREWKKKTPQERCEADKNCQYVGHWCTCEVAD